VKKRVYPDTNIALHYKRFDQLDWLKLVDASEVDLVLSPVFVAELDRKKYEGTRLVRARASERSTW
jgi:hypothetical protein